MREGEVRFRTVFVPAGTERDVFGRVGHDIVFRASSPASSGVWIANKRSDVRGKDARYQVFDRTEPLPLGKDQLLWVRNETKGDLYVSFAYWIAPPGGMTS